jgi:spore coat polysaccharide biosynthesis protein SpsF
MTSKRFPGKVLAPFAGKPLISHTIDRVKSALPRESIVIATSNLQSDDPLALYAESLGIRVFRGDLDDVFSRFRSCLIEHPCDHFFRICADSPLFDHSLIDRYIEVAANHNADLITNIQQRSFPKGNSLELLRASTFLNIDQTKLSDEEREHLTKFYYNNPNDFEIINISSGDPALANTSLVVDTLDDLHSLEERAMYRYFEVSSKS